MKVTKIHRIIEFTEESFMKPYIEFNTKQRQSAKNNFEKDFWKLMSNSVYGKSMESVRKRQNIKLYSDPEKVQKAINKTIFKSSTVFSENLVAIHNYKAQIEFNKPIYIGQVVLDLSKLLMYDFHYNTIKNNFGNKVKLNYMDTDSYIYEFNNANFSEFMKNNLDLFDTSDYPKESELYSEKNKKVIGKFKDELNGKRMTEFIGLRSKMYAYKTEKDESKRLKGIKKCVLKKITFDEYKKCLFENLELNHDQMVIRSHKHRLFTEKINKTSLSWKDDKRFLLSKEQSKKLNLKPTDTLAWGHYLGESVISDLSTQEL